MYWIAQLRLKTCLIIFMLSWAISSPLGAYESAQVKIELADELMECAVYYSMIRAEFLGSDLKSDIKEAEDYKNIADTLLQMSYKFKGNMSPEAFQAQLRLI